MLREGEALFSPEEWMCYLALIDDDSVFCVSWVILDYDRRAS